ncbi:MAG: 50S ribosomal protein L25/general stress protein Ctc [Rhodospirillales bacterium]|nr:50S ribosomal protein L25/general stress protein Ctc [Rhodospirillales bacterium]MBO6785432.1 50S ribosomal protein L25/general stress protein Ctc [Rhodospirillales bacterium]
MAQAHQLNAELRERAGKGAARAVRREGRVPAVIYGNKQEPVLISLDPVDLMKEYQKAGFFSHVYEIAVGGETYKVLARDLQTHPIKDHPIHVDFMRFSAKTRLAVNVYVEFVNEEECPGLKEGGVLNVVRHEVELRCSPDSIPESLIADLTGYEIGDSLHISAITLPEGVELTITDRDFTVATIAAPTVFTEVEDEEDEEGEAAEGEAAAEDGDEEGGDDGDEEKSEE